MTQPNSSSIEIALASLERRVAVVEKWIGEQPKPMTLEQDAEAMNSIGDNYGKGE